MVTPLLTECVFCLKGHNISNRILPQKIHMIITCFGRLNKKGNKSFYKSNKKRGISHDPFVYDYCVRIKGFHVVIIKVYSIKNRLQFVWKSHFEGT